MSVTTNNITENSTVTHDGNGDTPRSRRRSAREQVILDAARLLMAETGYDDMTMDDLAARALISKPTLYQYFPSKESVAVRAIIGFMRESHDYLDDLDASQPAVLRLETFVRWVLEQRFSPFRAAFGAAKTALAPVVRTHPDYQKEYARLVVAVTDLVEQAKSEDDFSHHLSTRVVVQTVFSFLRDSEYDLLVASGECTSTEIVQTLTAFFLCGIGYCSDTKALLLPSSPNVGESRRSVAFHPSSLQPSEPTG